MLQVGKPVADCGVCPAGEPGRGCLARPGWACSPLGVFREAEGAPSEVTSSPVLPGPSLALVLHLGPPGRGEGPSSPPTGPLWSPVLATVTWTVPSRRGMCEPVPGILGGLLTPHSEGCPLSLVTWGWEAP